MSKWAGQVFWRLGPRSRVVPVWNSRSLVADGDTGVGTPAAATPRAAFLDLTQIPLARHNVNDLILLGHFNGTNYFAYEIESADPPAAPSDTRYEDLRLLAAVLPPEDSGLLGYARRVLRMISNRPDTLGNDRGSS